VDGTPFDAVISTLPSRSIQYQGVVNTLHVLKQRLQPYYWSAVIGGGLPFQGVVETTHVLPLEWTGGRHLVYLMNYCPPSSAAYSTPDHVLVSRGLDGLSKLYPAFDRNQVEASYVFRAPRVEPVWPVGYLRRRPPVRAGARLFHCNTAQLYPAVNAWNSCVEQGNAVAEEVAESVIG
jgi:protoporphyrinogen oxidase